MKTRFFLAMLVVMLAFGFGLTGCRTVGALYEVNGVIREFPTIRVPAKDFTSLGIVLAEGVISSNQGEVYTYYALWREAQKLGADSIVNVTYGKKLREGSTDEVWYGAATAIKYVPGVIINTSATISIRDGTTTTVTSETTLMSEASNSSSGATATAVNAIAANSDSSSERKWYLPWTWFKKG